MAVNGIDNKSISERVDPKGFKSSRVLKLWTCKSVYQKCRLCVCPFRQLSWRKPERAFKGDGEGLECCFCGERAPTIRTGIVATKGPKHPFPRERDN